MSTSLQIGSMVRATNQTESRGIVSKQRRVPFRQLLHIQLSFILTPDWGDVLIDILCVRDN